MSTNGAGVRGCDPTYSRSAEHNHCFRAPKETKINNVHIGGPAHPPSEMDVLNVVETQTVDR
jgi:hypothetical protein